MTHFSAEHQAEYKDMLTEMIRYAGFQDGVRAELRHIKSCYSMTGQQRRIVDDLFGI
jgi:hypothetical protein